MKLNEIISSVPVRAAGVQFQEAGSVPANYGGAIARAMTQAGQDIEQTGNEAFRVARHADAQRRHLEEANQAASLVTGAELQLKQHRANVVQGQDYNGFVGSYQAGANEIISSTLKQTNNPNVKAAVKLRLTKAAGNEVIDVQQDALRKFKDVQTATLDQNITNTLTLASTATKPEDLGNYIGLGIGNIEAMVAGGLITAVDGGKRKRDFLGDLEMVKARQDMQADPETFIKEAERYQYLDPVKRQSLVEHAGKLAEQNANRAERVARQAEADAAREEKRRQSYNSTMLMQRLVTGKAGAGDVMSMAANRDIDEQDQRAALSYIDMRNRRAESEANRAEMRADRAQRAGEHRSEMGIRDVDAMLGVMATTGEKDVAGLIDFAKSHNLPPRAIDGALAKAKAYQSSLDSAYRSQHSQAEQMLKSAFPRGAFETIEPTAQPAYAAALDELTMRSKAFSGKEDPLKVAQEIIPRYQASIDADNTVKIGGLRSRLKFQSPDELEANKALIPPTFYNEQKRIMKELWTLEQPKVSAPETKKAPGTLSNIWNWMAPKAERPAPPEPK